jgi:hypothetical protein
MNVIARHKIVFRAEVLVELIQWLPLVSGGQIRECLLDRGHVFSQIV